MSNSEERSPKRQRRSYSPSSPSTGLNAKSTHPQQSAQQNFPETPPPSVHMSPSWQGQNYPSSATGGTTFPTPPSTSGYHSQHMPDRGPTDSDRGQESEHPTPVTTSAQGLDADGDAEMRDPAITREVESGAADHRRSDHERHTAGDVPGAQKLYLYITEHVISLYSLKDIQGSVARRDAKGNKINKLRKSYENKVKALGLEGRSKAEVGSLALQGLLDPGWDVDIGNGTTAWQARTSEFPLGQDTVDDVLGKLSAALAFAPGHLPKAEHENWKGILGLDDATAVRPMAPGASVLKSAGPANPLIARTAPAAAARASAPSSPRNAVRPERANKKRRYDESSYTGYQEGYDDDGYSTGGGLDEDGRRIAGAKRQKRKVSFMPESVHLPQS